jgi:hypothetical protein
LDTYTGMIKLNNETYYSDSSNLPVLQNWDTVYIIFYNWAS